MSVESPRMLTERGTVAALERAGDAATTRDSDPNKRLVTTHARAMTLRIRHMAGQAKPTAQRVSGTTSPGTIRRSARRR
jgi:hypothetical protein